MRKFDVTVFAMVNDVWTEVYDCEVIEANDEKEALSVAKDMLDYAGYSADEIAELDLRIKEME